MYRENKKHTKKKRRALYIGIATVVLLGLVCIFLFKTKYNQTSGPNPDSNEIAASSDEAINYEPPTEADKSDVEANKESIANDQNQQNQAKNTLKSVTPVITSSGQFGDTVEVRAFIPGIYESSGKCNAVFSKGSSSINRLVEAIQDATTTRCDTITVKSSDFLSKGSWSVVISYESTKHKGSSEPKSIEVK